MHLIGTRSQPHFLQKSIKRTAGPDQEARIDDATYHTIMTTLRLFLLAAVSAASLLPLVLLPQAVQGFVVTPSSSSSSTSSCKRSSRSPTRIMMAASSSSSSSSSTSSAEQGEALLTKGPVVIFPAQFGVAADYEELVAELNARGHPAIPLGLKRFDWLKITRSIPTKDYWAGTLQPKGTLDFYLNAAEEAVAEAKERYPGRKIHLLAHSIGGWIARAYCGEVADPDDVDNLFVSLTTLGSPHYPPKGEGVWSKVDQTRGLLSYVDENFPGAHHEHFTYVSVGGISTQGKLGGGLEESVAYISYLPLCGNGETTGDGIIPEDVCFLDGAVHVRVPDVKHSSFIPTAGPSIKIPGYVWYGTPHVVDRWAGYLDEAERKASKRRQGAKGPAPMVLGLPQFKFF